MHSPSPPPPPAPASFRDETLLALRGRFRDGALEDAFLGNAAPEWARRLRRFALVAAALFALFGFADYRMLGWGPALWWIWGVRLGLAAVALGIAHELGRRARPVTTDGGALALMAAVALFALAVLVIERNGVARQAPATLLAVIAFYVFIPARFALQAGASVALSLLVVWIDRRWGTLAGGDWTVTVGQFAVCNLLGAHAALTGHLSARREYLALRHERHHKRELQDMVAALEKSNAELEQFAYVASHDLQSPLRNVISFAQLLQRRHGSALGAQGGEYLATILQSASHMHRLITDLLGYSRVGRGTPELVPVDTAAVLDEVRHDLAGRLAESHAEITSSPLPTVPASPLELRQLFQNLVDNALKFQNGHDPRIHVSARAAEGGWEFSVRDNGIGIRPEHHDRIFKMFGRLHEAAAYPGSGIGLAICRKIVEQHGGRIWVESDAGRGATFRFTLPAAR